MNCLKIGEIYDYLEGNLPPAQQAELERHLSACPRCEEAVVARRLIEQAASTLPDLELPPDFSRRVMATILHQEGPLPRWFAALVVGLSSLGLVCFLLAISGGGAGLTFVSGFLRFFLAYFQNATVFLAKVMILLSSAGKTLRLILSAMAKCFSLLHNLISPEVQAIILISAVALFITLYFGLKKKLLSGEKT